MGDSSTSVAWVGVSSSTAFSWVLVWAKSLHFRVWGLGLLQMASLCNLGFLSFTNSSPPSSSTARQLALQVKAEAAGFLKH